MMELGSFSEHAVLSDWLRELEVVRRLSRFYPAGHPSLAPALERLAEAETFLGSHRCVLEVRRHAFFFGDEAVTSARHPARQLAHELFRVGIIGMAVNPPFDSGQREMTVALIAGLKGRLSTLERDRWLADAKRLSSIELIAFTSAATKDPSTTGEVAELSEMELATLLGLSSIRLGEAGGPGGARALAHAVNHAPDPFGFLQELVDQVVHLLDRYEEQGAALRGMALLSSIREMTRAVDPENRMLLMRLMIQRSEGGELRARMTEALLAEDLLDVVEAMLAAKATVPEMAQRAVYTLAAPPHGHEPDRDELPPEITIRARRILPRLTLSETSTVTEHSETEDSPAAQAFTEQLSNWPRVTEIIGAGVEVSASLGPGPIRRHAAWLLRQVHELVPRSELGRLAARGLVNRYFEHLELGEFTAAIEVAQDLLRHGRHTEIERLVDNEGLSALLEALGTWGKDRRAEVMMVVAMLGERIAPSVVRRMADEELLAVRKRLLEMIVIIGPTSAPELRRILKDSRWFVVRNAVHLLHEVAPREYVDAIASLITHSDRRVVSEAVAYLLDADDRRGLVGLRSLLSSDSEEGLQEGLSVASRRRRQDVAAVLAAQLGSFLEEPRSHYLPEIAKMMASSPCEEATTALIELASLTGRRHRHRLAPAFSAMLNGLASRRDPGAQQILEALAQQKDQSGERARTMLKNWKT